MASALIDCSSTESEPEDNELEINSASNGDLSESSAIGEDIKENAAQEKNPSTGQLCDKAKQKRKLRAYTVMEKLEIVRFAKEFGKRAAARKFKGVSRKSIREWCKAEQKLQDHVKTGTGKRQEIGVGRKPAYPDLEQSLVTWFDTQRKLKRRVTRKLLFLQAKQIFDGMIKSGEVIIDNDNDVPESEILKKSFAFSNGWLMRFMQRQKLTTRRKTTGGQKVPAEVIDKLVNFVIYVRQIRKQHQYPMSSIIAADEMAVWPDGPGRTTVEHQGMKQVAIASTGYEKMRITVMLSAKADGTKLKPFVVLDRKRPMPELEKFKSKLAIVYAGKSWMDDELIATYLKDVVGNSIFDTRRLLVWDSFRCHISDSTKNQLKRLKIDSAVVPGGCTKYVQAPDVVWNKPFKDRLGEYYDHWMANDEKEKTKSGKNLKPPSWETICQWIIDAWASLSKEMIVNSFKCCGVSNAIDESEDNLITCFKENNECAARSDLLKESWAAVKDQKNLTLQDIFLEESDDEDEELIML